MSNDAILPLALGAGGGLLLGYYFHDKREKDKHGDKPATGNTSDAAPPTNTDTTASTAPAASATSAPAPASTPTATASTARACALRLDAMGLTADGARVGVADAVNRCKTAGSAEVTIIPNASAAAYSELMISLGRAGVPTYAHRNAGGGRRGARAGRYSREGRTILRDGVGIAMVERVDLGNQRYAISPHEADQLSARIVRLLNSRNAGAGQTRNDSPEASRFTVAIFPRGDEGGKRLYYYDADPPTTFEDARARLAAAGVIDPSMHLRTRYPGGWVMTTDPRVFLAAKAEPLPNRGTPRGAATYRGFTVRIYPEGSAKGGASVRWFVADPPTTWNAARDRLIAAGILDPDGAGRTQQPGGWMVSVDPHEFRASKAEPLPGADHGA